VTAPGRHRAASRPPLWSRLPAWFRAWFRSETVPNPLLVTPVYPPGAAPVADADPTINVLSIAGLSTHTDLPPALPVAAPPAVRPVLAAPPKALPQVAPYVPDPEPPVCDPGADDRQLIPIPVRHREAS
jgi:hypothetical protein